MWCRLSCPITGVTPIPSREVAASISKSRAATGNGLAARLLTPSDVASISNFAAADNGYGITNSGTVLTRQNNTFYANTWGNQGSFPDATAAGLRSMVHQTWKKAGSRLPARPFLPSQKKNT